MTSGNGSSSSQCCDNKGTTSSAMVEYLRIHVISLVPLVAFAGAAACSQILDGFIPITEVLALQFLSQALGRLPFVLISLCQTPPEPERRHYVGVIIMCLLKFMANMFLFISLNYGAAGVIQGIYNISATCICIFYCMWKTRSFAIRLWLPLAITTIGVIMTSQPTFLGFPPLRNTHCYISICIQDVNCSTFKPGSNSLLNDSTMETSNMSILPTSFTSFKAREPIGILLASFAGVCQGSSFLLYTEYIPDVSPMSLSVGVGGICAVLGTLGLLIFQRPVMPTGALCLLTTFGLIVPQGLGTTVLNYSLLKTGPAAVTIILTMTPVLVMIFQYTFLSHIRPGHRNWEEMVGIILLTVANILYPAFTLLEERKQSEYESFNDEEINYASQETGKDEETSID